MSEKKVRLVWADKFRQLVYYKKISERRLIALFLEYCESEENKINERIKTQWNKN